MPEDQTGCYSRYLFAWVCYSILCVHVIVIITDFKPPEQLSLMQQLQQQVPKHLIFPKSSIQLGSTVGQGNVYFMEIISMHCNNNIEIYY